MFGASSCCLLHPSAAGQLVFDMAVSPGAGRGCQDEVWGAGIAQEGLSAPWGCGDVQSIQWTQPCHSPCPTSSESSPKLTCHQLPKPCSISPCSGCVALQVLSLWLPAKLWGEPSSSSLHSHVIKSSGELVVLFGSCPFPQPCHIKGFLEPAAQDPNL